MGFFTFFISVRIEYTRAFKSTKPYLSIKKHDLCGDQHGTGGIESSP